MICSQKILNKARSAVEGLQRSIPFSQTKLEMSNKYLYWQLKVKKMQGKQVNVERMMRRKELGNVEDNVSSLLQVNEKL
jgi:hypothetical protein